MTRNCTARSRQQRSRLATKFQGFTPRLVPLVRPNDNRKPPSHAWRRHFTPYVKPGDAVSPFDLYGGWHW
jgi:hypothetical protein